MALQRRDVALGNWPSPEILLAKRASAETGGEPDGPLLLAGAGYDAVGAGLPAAGARLLLVTFDLAPATPFAGDGGYVADPGLRLRAGNILLHRRTDEPSPISKLEVAGFLWERPDANSGRRQSVFIRYLR